MEEWHTVSYEEDNEEEEKKSELFKILLEHEEDLKEFKKQFGTEDACRNQLREWRWPNGFTCDRCGSRKKAYRNKNRKNIYQCRDCGYQATLTVGTIFHKTRFPLTRWFLMIYLIKITEERVRLSYFQRLWDTDNYKAVWIMADKIKKALSKSDEYLKLVGLADRLK